MTKNFKWKSFLWYIKFFSSFDIFVYIYRVETPLKWHKKYQSRWDRTYMRNGLSVKPISFWPSGSVKEFFSLFLVHSEPCLVISIIFYFLKKIVTVWMHNDLQWSSLCGFKMVRAGVSTMKFKEVNHDEPPQCTSLVVHLSEWIGTGMSHAFRS